MNELQTQQQHFLNIPKSINQEDVILEMTLIVVQIQQFTFITILQQLVYEWKNFIYPIMTISS
jgi:hypothetical protein